MGPLSRLISHAVENVHDSWLLQTTAGDMMEFSKAIAAHWRQLKLSQIDASEEKTYFDASTSAEHLPALWKILRSAFFATTIVLRGLIGRALGDPKLASHHGELFSKTHICGYNDTTVVAPVLASQCLHALRNFSFVSSRLGSNAFSQYTFVYLTAIDILSAYPSQAACFMQEVAPSSLGHVSSSALDRSEDLFFLNTAEYFALVLSPQMNEALLLAAASPYLAAGGDNHLLEIFEAAHSVMLAVLSAPQSAELAAVHIPFYVDTLFKVSSTELVFNDSVEY